MSSTRRILFLAANPADTVRLKLGEEASLIRKGLERSKHRQHFDTTERWAVGPDELRQALLDVEPQIVHFSGHGAGTDGLMLQAADSRMILASSEALSRLFALFAGQIECVLLNACYSEVQAEAIYQHVDYVIGMGRAVGDHAALEFAKGFYDALGAGRSYEVAYKFGCSAIDFEDVRQSLTPVLKARRRTITIPPVAPSSNEQSSAELVSLEKPNSEPLPESTGKMLEIPEGQVPLGSPFYIERPPIEADCYAAIVKPGALIRVKAARQMGKTSLMSRILDHATQQGYRAVRIYLQEADREIFTNLNHFLQSFCATVTQVLGLPDQVDVFGRRGSLGSKRKCTNYFQQYLLPEINTPLVLGLDEVDLVFQHLIIAQDFFALLRAWHERGRNEPVWQKLRLIIVHSREVYIPLHMQESPFNVGLPVALPELTLSQVQDLLQRHGLAWTDEQMGALMAMLGGHPYQLIHNPQVLCVTSPQFRELGFANQLQIVLDAFPKNIKHDFVLNSTDLSKILLKERVDIIHIAAFVCPRGGDLYFSEVQLPLGKSIAKDVDLLSPEALVALLEKARTRLVVLGGSESLVLAADLLPVTNVIAARDMVSAKAMAKWVETFYRTLATEPLATSSEIASRVSQAPMKLYAQQRQAPSLRFVAGSCAR